MKNFAITILKSIEAKTEELLEQATANTCTINILDFL